ncbi:MAG: HEPN domain-containing protein [Nitrospinae bacterium]|nr:HEPN domain-containing protein [Nitrospinota bacterium]
MKPPDEIKKELVRQWLEKAEKDMGVAKLLLLENASFPEAIGFHCQQATEKFLKAYMVMIQADFPKTHNLGELLDIVAKQNPRMAASLNDITELNPFGVDFRYPGDLMDTSRNDAERAFELAGKTRETVLAALEIAK